MHYSPPYSPYIYSLFVSILSKSSVCIYLPFSLHSFCFFFFNDTATTEIYTLSLHDALPISHPGIPWLSAPHCEKAWSSPAMADRKSTRLNSSHTVISYAVFCLKKKKKKKANY